MTDKKINMHKEIAMGIEGKYATTPKSTNVQNKKCGGAVMKRAPIKAKKSK